MTGDPNDRYIVTMPFDQNPVLHIYAGMLWMYTAWPESPEPMGVCISCLVSVEAQRRGRQRRGDGDS